MTKHNLRILLAAVIITAALTTLFLLALAGETETTTASYGYQADTAVEEVKNPAETAGDVETTHKPEITVPDTTVPETTVPETTAPETETPHPPLISLKEEEVESIMLVTILRDDVIAAVAGGQEVRALALTATTVENGCAIFEHNFEHGTKRFECLLPEQSPEQNKDLPQPVLVYFILA